MDVINKKDSNESVHITLDKSKKNLGMTRLTENS